MYLEFVTIPKASYNASAAECLFPGSVSLFVSQATIANPRTNASLFNMTRQTVLFWIRSRASVWSLYTISARLIPSNSYSSKKLYPIFTLLIFWRQKQTFQNHSDEGYDLNNYLHQYYHCTVYNPRFLHLLKFNNSLKQLMSKLMDENTSVKILVN